MGRTIARFAGPVLRAILGAVASAAVGAAVGLALFVTGLASGMTWLDWVLAGVAFGLVVGGIGAVTGGLARVLVKVSAPKFGARPFAAGTIVAAVSGSVPGIVLGLGFQRGVTEPIFYGTFGAIGAAVAARVGGWRAEAGARPRPTSEVLDD
ncbi:MAG: hypothetical protein LC745_00575 [Planctomycetia bacterium]|nr:hypothetical protein [Planctomycetia bacterium]